MQYLKIKRVYEQPSAADGTRVLIDRLWPRGLARRRAAVDLWLKQLAPTDALRKWFNHDPARWQDFQARYRAELAGNIAELGKLSAIVQAGPVTLLYGAKDETHNNAVVLEACLRAAQRRHHAARRQR